MTRSDLHCLHEACLCFAWVYFSIALCCVFSGDDLLKGYVYKKEVLFLTLCSYFYGITVQILVAFQREINATCLLFAR